MERVRKLEVETDKQFQEISDSISKRMNKKVGLFDGNAEDEPMDSNELHRKVMKTVAKIFDVDGAEDKTMEKKQESNMDGDTGPIDDFGKGDENLDKSLSDVVNVLEKNANKIIKQVKSELNKGLLDKDTEKEQKDKVQVRIQLFNRTEGRG